MVSVMNNRDYILAKQMNGKKFFRYLSKETGEVLSEYIDDKTDVDELRVIKIKNESEITILKSDGTEQVVCPSFITENEYVELIPHGYLSISNVTGIIKGISYDDVIVAVYKMEDIFNKIVDPQIVCRQNINDIFYTYLKDSHKVDYVGASVSKLTCPENIDMKEFMACDALLYNYSIYYYIDDTLDYLMSLINTKKFDKVLNNLFLKYAKDYNVYINPKIDYEKDYVSVMGHCPNLKALLKDNNFTYDFSSMFGITEINIKLEEHLIINNDKVLGEYQTIDDDTVMMFSHLFKKNLTNILVIKYDDDIDISEIKGSFYLLRDESTQLYILSYNIVGEYRQTDLEVIAAEEVMKRYSSVLNNKYKK